MAFIPAYILILFVTIIVDYYAGILIENATGKAKKRYLILSLVSNLAFLGFFKYFNFAAGNLNALASFLHWNYSILLLSIALPVGLSFHTFQAMAYTMEVYRRNQKAERHFGIYALYVMFYPQLVAGPIERPQHLIHQFREKHEFDYDRIKSGLLLMLWGLVKKVVIADRLAMLVNAVYDNPTTYPGPLLILATIAFAFQIYCDFSGYSDIAIGAARVMGFKLMRNFNRPYASRSVAEFWTRWHISLSSWFRDYVYIPLGGNRTSPLRWYSNLFLTFLLSGLWHGADWKFIIWGALNGFYLLCSIWTKSLREKMVQLSGLGRLPRLHRAMQTVFTFSLICLTWIFFRANNLAEAQYIFTHLFQKAGAAFQPHVMSYWIVKIAGFGKQQIVIALASVAMLEFVHSLQAKGSVLEKIQNTPVYCRWPIYCLLIHGILFLGIFKHSQFIYFQF